MPKKLFKYKQLGTDIWYTDSLKGWFIVKQNQDYCIRKGRFINNNTIEFGTKIYKKYKRLGDGKVGIENMLKLYIKNIKQQEELFNELQKLNKKDNEIKGLDYEFLNKEAERLKKKWGLC